MTKRIAPGLGLGYGWDLGESGLTVKDGMDTNFLTTSVLLNLSVLSRTTSLPASPSAGMRYIVPVGEANANKVAVRTGTTWLYYAPLRNWEARVEDAADAKVVFNGTAWVEASTGGGGTPAPALAAAALTSILTTPADTAADKDILTLTLTSEQIKAGLVLDAAFYGTQSQAAVSQNLIFYAKVNGGAAVTIGQVGAGSSAQSYRAISGKCMFSLLSIGASGSYALGGEFMINGLVPYSSTSASARSVNTTSGLTVTIGIRNSVANTDIFENIVGAYIRQVV